MRNAVLLLVVLAGCSPKAVPTRDFACARELLPVAMRTRYLADRPRAEHGACGFGGPRHTLVWITCDDASGSEAKRRFDDEVGDRPVVLVPVASGGWRAEGPGGVVFAMVDATTQCGVFGRIDDQDDPQAIMTDMQLRLGDAK